MRAKQATHWWNKITSILLHLSHSSRLVNYVMASTGSIESGKAMASVFDVAQYILKQKGRMTTWKLQKLVYYSQAWSLVWDERPLFPEPIEAWANGPVCPALYKAHRGAFDLEGIALGNADLVDATARETIDAVLKLYGDKGSQWLSDLTHAEEPWQIARSGLSDGERGNVEITHGTMADYYGNL